MFEHILGDIGFLGALFMLVEMAMPIIVIVFLISIMSGFQTKKPNSIKTSDCIDYNNDLRMREIS